MAAGSSSPISSANDFLSPLCGVALASTSASVRAASRRARRLRKLVSPIRLCDSSITTASQAMFSRWCPYMPTFFSVSMETMTRLK
jgi:hypothetical protein